MHKPMKLQVSVWGPKGKGHLLVAATSFDGSLHPIRVPTSYVSSKNGHAFIVVKLIKNEKLGSQELDVILPCQTEIGVSRISVHDSRLIPLKSNEKPATYHVNKFPKRLREARKKAGMTQDDLGDDAGLSMTQISHYETGRYMPTSLMLTYIATSLGVKTDWLLGREENADES